MAKHVPNILTIFRFLLIPVMIFFFLKNNYIAAFILITISGITDILDGYIARHYNYITNFGKLVDPLADKATQLSMLWCLSYKNIIPFWIITVFIFKEFLMIAGASFLYGKELVVSSKWYGKLSTVLLYIAIISSFFTSYYNSICDAPIIPFDIYIFYLAVLSTIFSLIMYIRSFIFKGYLKQEKTQ